MYMHERNEYIMTKIYSIYQHCLMFRFHLYDVQFVKSVLWNTVK